MRRSNAYPALRHLLSLAQDTQFPATAEEIGFTAHRWRFPKEVIDFIELFYPDELFLSRTDFMLRCEELELEAKSDKMPLGSRRHYVSSALKRS